MAGWDVSRVGRMAAMFANALSFNKPVGVWDVTKVVSLSKMFSVRIYKQS